MTRRAPARRTGAGPRQVTVRGHFGELLQGRLGPSGPLVLLTLPGPGAVTAAVRRGPMALSPPGLIPPAAWRALRRPGWAVRLRTDLEPGAGCGASTAALLALGQALDRPLPPARLLALEGAVDPLMLPRPGEVLWAPREARALAPMPAPRFEVLGALVGPPQRTQAADLRFPDVSDLVAAWPSADLAGRARLATCSARRTRALRGGPDLDPWDRAGQDTGALGLAIAHTGAAVALLYAPGTAPAASLLRSLGGRRCCRFRT